MKRRLILASAAVVLMALAAPIPANAQNIYVLAGPTFPVGDFSDFAKTGWYAAGGVTFPVGQGGAWAGGELSYGQNKHDTNVLGVFDGDKTNLIGLMAILGYDIPSQGSVNPFVWGGLGLLVHKFAPDIGSGDSESNFGYQFGGGLSFGGDESNVHPFVEARFEGASASQFVAVEAGVSFGVGN